MNGLSSSTICCKIGNHVSNLLEKWQSLLGIHHWTITCEPIDEMQVVDALDGDTPGHEFVGIAIDFTNETGIIYHTRPLQEDDVIHELLHVRFPDWSEQKVDYWTNLLIDQPDINLLKLNGINGFKTGSNEMESKYSNKNVINCKSIDLTFFGANIR